jgi:hypothetical protein
MSYDIHALRVDPGEATEVALETIMQREQLDEREPRDPAKDARKRSIAGALTTAGLGYAVVEHDYAELARAEQTTEDEARRQVRHLQLDNGTLLVELDEEHATLKVPYSSTLLEGDLAGEVFATLAALRAEAHLIPYDPQLGRELDPDTDRDAFLEAFRRGLEEARGKGAEEEARLRPRAPWWKRLLRIG